jgi:hypothetical protein
MSLLVPKSPSVVRQKAKCMSVVLFLTIVNKFNSYILLFLPFANQAVGNAVLLLDGLSNVFASLAFGSYRLAKPMHPHATLGTGLDWVHYFVIVAKTS